MNIFKKPEKNLVTFYLEEKDFEYPHESLEQNLVVALSEIEGGEIKFKMDDIKDLPLSALSILFCFFKSANLKKSHIILEADSTIVDGILSIGIGGLSQLFEVR